jgi:hypothetical protein
MLNKMFDTHGQVNLIGTFRVHRTLHLHVCCFTQNCLNIRITPHCLYSWYAGYGTLGTLRVHLRDSRFSAYKHAHTQYAKPPLTINTAHSECFNDKQCNQTTKSTEIDHVVPHKTHKTGSSLIICLLAVRQHIHSHQTFTHYDTKLS